jgi:hypothetical protein
LIAVVVLFVASSVAANAFAELQSAATAMACCANTNYECAGMSGPDDCCQRMRHTAGRTVAATFSSARLLVIPSAIVVDSFVVQHTPASALQSAGPAFKRPHDPPHLHPYSLLI